MPTIVKWIISFIAGAGLIAVGWTLWSPLLVVLHVLVCLTLCLVVLLQSGKAADLAGAFGGAGSQTAFGPRGAATFLSKATTWCAVMFMATSMALTLRATQQGPATGGSVLEGTAPAQTPAPATPPPAQQTPPAGTQTPPANTPAQTPGQSPAQAPSPAPTAPAKTPASQPKQ